jgi:two-component system KDP operon response regulator KdpE
VSRVLVIEDELPMRRALNIGLKARGYDVELADTGTKGLDLAAHRHPDLIILDLGLPDMDGVDVARTVREWSMVPIIVLSARDAERVKVAALDAGADDYVTKPFGMDELLARLRAALRRNTTPDQEPVVETPDFTVDLASKQVKRNGDVVHLTPTEWHLVEALVRDRGKLVTHSQLLKQVWGPEYNDETHYLRFYLSQIRRKLEPEPSRPRYFLTEPGMGYRFVV